MDSASLQLRDLTARASPLSTRDTARSGCPAHRGARHSGALCRRPFAVTAARHLDLSALGNL